MGHSVVEYRGQTRLLHDIEIVTVVHIVLDVSRQPPGAPLPADVEELLDAWSTLLDSYGPGTLDLELDGYLSSDGDRDALLELLDRARQRLRDLGDIVPGDYMNRIVDAPALFEFVDRPVADVLPAFDKLEAVLRTPPAT